MHLLAATPGAIDDGAQAIDLGQTPGDIVVLSAADTELVCLANARNRLGDGFGLSLRLASLLHLGHPASVDLYLDATLATSRMIVCRLLGGRSYWAYGVEQVAALARRRQIPVAFVPGDDQPDEELVRLSTVSGDAWHRLWQYLVHGGTDNAAEFLRFAGSLLGKGDPDSWREPRPMLHAGLYWPGRDQATLEEVSQAWTPDRPVASVLFYRALIQAGNLPAIDALIEGLQRHGLNPLPVFVTSLKDPLAAATVEHLFAITSPDIVLNGTGFAVGTPGGAAAEPLAGHDAPVLQVIFAGSDEATWRDCSHGLAPRDIAMNVALPEVDGRIITRAVSFKGSKQRDAATQTSLVTYTPVADRIDYVCRLASNWVRLRRAATADRRVALVLANYPNRDGRLGNGVGLDVPASVITILEALDDAGYAVNGRPADGNALMARVMAGPTNDLGALSARTIEKHLSLDDYTAAFAALPEAARQKMLIRWGAPDADPFVVNGDAGAAFALPVLTFGSIVVAVQPARGYNIDPAASYHDPDLAPPHNYFALYVWLTKVFDAHAVVHVGKHGNLEWLPGKSVALAADCFPEAMFAPLPHLYPFIVNDPGEGTQAKRRTQAVIIDHLTPPLTRAESYGPHRDLERLVDEYYEAAQVDPRRLRLLGEEIIALCRSARLDGECGIGDEDTREDALFKLDRYLCELKEMQIRDGLHVFGRAPEGGLLRDLLVALTRVPRGAGEGGDASLLRALALDLVLGFDPLDCDLAMPWEGPCPSLLDGGEPWRTNGDTIERLEGLAANLVTANGADHPELPRTSEVLRSLNEAIRPAVLCSGEREIEGLLTGLDGRFVAPGPSGAPTRGRPDVLPTGRNFYGVDSRTVPTPSAWALGWKSAALLVERHAQDHGDWPRHLALTAWGTSNMRTGGDDIAQALALMGVRPTWETTSRRVTGFEILPLSVLDRPRVDVTLRVSGFFRDAFSNLIDLFDSAARAVAALDEPDDANPLAARVRADRTELEATGSDPALAQRLAGARVFGSQPGAYGAGLQALIDERGWRTAADLARAYVAWGGYAYGGGLKGTAAHRVFERRLKQVDVVVQNQDNREHDLLDSDDYYQFEGGLTAAVRELSGAQPTTYHLDHARPETPRVRTLNEEVSRVMRARVVNPKWIAGVMRHGYKGAFEMAATVDYLFAFAATAHCVEHYQFDMVFDAYLEDDTVRDFLAENNPAALKEMSERLLEAQERGLWRPSRNTAYDQLKTLAGQQP